MVPTASYLRTLMFFIFCSLLLEFSGFARGSMPPVYGKNTTSTDDAVNTPIIIGQKVNVIIMWGLAAGMTAVLVAAMFLFLLHKKHNNSKCSRVLLPPLAAAASEETTVKEVKAKWSEGQTKNNSGISNPCTSTGGGVGSTSSSSANNKKSLEKRVCWWGLRYSWSELETATNRFAKENLIGEGLYGVVYKGYLKDGCAVAVKNLTGSRGQAKEIYDVEVESNGTALHRNIVNLFGFCVQGAQRSLVYEYVDNGNLKKWLHGDTGTTTSPLTWDIRMKIVIEVAKGLAYLHQSVTPKVVHGNVKSSNILLDKDWNPKLADFGLAKLLNPERKYESPHDYANTGAFYDVYSFGVLLMEIVTGRSPSVDDSNSRGRGERRLVDWFKRMVASRREEQLLDPKMGGVCPSQISLARAVLVCLACMDVASKPLTMQQVVYLLEADEHLFYREPPRPPFNNCFLMHMPLLNFLYKRVMVN